MTLRTLGDHPRRSARRPSSLRLLGACATLVVVLLGLFAGSSGADVSSYTGTLYLTKTASGIGTGNWQLATSAPSSVDNTTQNRVAFSPATTGYALFAPGVNPGLGNTSAPSSISVSTCTGWVVDGTGGMTFPAASWTFQATVEDPLSANGQAKLTAALYEVDASGNVVATIVSPTDGAANLIRSSGATTTTVSISAAASSFSLSSSQHLCLMFWRHQTTTYTSGGAATRLFKLDVNDGTASITSHPVPDAFPTVTLASTPADGSYVIAGQTLTLGATYSDPESEAGTVVIQVCPDSACSSVTASNTFNSVSSGSSVTWSPSLADGTWYWRASGTDSAGGQSWSATHSFTLDTTVPSAPALVSPNDGVTTNNLALTATFSDPSVSDSGTLEFRICSDSLCASPVTTSPPTSTLANNANGSWTISPAPPDGTYYWEAQAYDTAGNASSWSSSRSVTFDRTPPATTITSNPPTLSTSSSANFSFSADDPTATFECNLDGAGWGTTCTSPTSYSGLADGSHTLQVRGTDNVGNVGTAASYTWSIDTTVPSSPALSGPADAALLNAIPQLGGSFTDPTSGDTGVVDFRVCTSAAVAGSTCSGLVQSGSSSTVTSGSTGTYTPSGLADGTYDWQARAQDTAGNPSGWTATRSFTLDTTPPDTTIGPTEPPLHSGSTTASFDLASTESGSTFQCSLDGAAFTSCTTPVSYSSLTEATHTFSVEATDPAGNTDPSPATYTWTVDTTPPDTSIGPTQPPAVATSSSATFDFSATEPSTFECSRDGSAWASCTSPKTYSGLTESSHTFQVRATDLAGNVDATPASYSWYADTSVPPTPGLVAPTAGFATNTLPQLRATFTDPNSSDSGTVEFRICSAAASAGTACSPMVDDVSSAVVASGATASYTPSSLTNGVFYWQALAQDSAGNQSAWTATRSFIYDTNIPDVPVLQSPDNGGWVRSVKLTAKFNEPAFAGTGSIEFRICSDALCLAVSASGMTGTVPNGTFAGWEAPHLLDGYWWWQARAHDAAGNVSAWSSIDGFHLDATPPAAPTHFNGTIGANGLTLRWNPPVDTIANFVVYVNGNSGPYLGGVTYEYNVGAFDAGDTRTFSVRAVDRAGNFGAMSTVLVGVPNLVGLTLGQAENATQSRGLVLRRASSLMQALPMIVVSQDPAPASVESLGSAVKVVLKEVPSGQVPFTVQVLPVRVACAAGSILRVHLQLSLLARVRAQVVGHDGRVLATRVLGRVLPGDAVVRVRLPKSSSGVAKVVFAATSSDGRTGHAVVRVVGGKRGCHALHRRPH